MLFDGDLQHWGQVVQHEVVSPRYRRMTLFCPRVARAARAGQFVHILTRDDRSFDPLLRRAFSIMQTADDTFTILYRIEGRGTSLLSHKQVGDKLSLLGPLGQCFAPPGANVLLVGGGVGMPPLLRMAQQIRDEQNHFEDKTTITAFVGARSREDVLCVDELRSLSVEVQVATDDGSLGERAKVTELLAAYFSDMRDDFQVTQAGANLVHRENVVVCSCGPFAMLRAVAEVCEQFGVRCQVSLEENMPCGVGVCNGCVVEMAQSDNEYSKYQRICVDGPVMWAHELKW